MVTRRAFFGNIGALVGVGAVGAAVSAPTTDPVKPEPQTIVIQVDHDVLVRKVLEGLPRRIQMMGSVR